MTHPLRTRLPLLLLLLPLLPLQAGEMGEALHDESCQGCHDNDIYSRESRQVDSHANLGSRVRMCRDNLGVSWFDDETNQVVDYLNAHYYHFE